MREKIGIIFVGFLLSASFLFAESQGNITLSFKVVEEVDTTPPAAVTDLAIQADVSFSTITLTWTAPGDDGTIGEIIGGQYQIKWATYAINSGNWDVVVDSAIIPTDIEPGHQEVVIVPPELRKTFPEETTYWFALKTADEIPNWSEVSNSPSLYIPDLTPPAVVSDLEVANGPGARDATLTWTAPGDDGTVGDIVGGKYQIKYATYEINAGNWKDISAEVSISTNVSPGDEQSYVVGSLNFDTTYYFALKTADEAENWSEISNSDSLYIPIPEDTTSPAAVADLAVEIKPSAQKTVATLTWTAPGDDGTIGNISRGKYQIKYATYAINAENWEIVVDSVIFSTNTVPGASQTKTIQIADNLLVGVTYYFALKTADEVENWSGISNVVSGYLSSDLVQVPQKMGKPQVEDVLSDSGGALIVKWEAIENVEYYTIYYATFEFSGKDVECSTFSATLSSATLTGLVVDAGYYVRISGTDEDIIIEGEPAEGELSTLAGPIYAANNIADTDTSDVEIICSFDIFTKVKINQGTNDGTIINILEPAAAKKSIIDAADENAKITAAIISKSVDKLAKTTKEIINQPPLITAPIQIILSYKNIDISEIDENSLRIFRLNEVIGKWEIVGGLQVVDKTNKNVSAEVSQLSVFRILGTQEEVAAADLENVKVYPNPCKPSAGQNEITFANLTSGAKVQIYNIAGELVKELDAGDTGKIKWDIKNEDNGYLASGVYIYLITDEDNHLAKGKLAIIR